MTIFTALLIIVISLFLIIWGIGYICHKQMTADDCDEWDFGTFDQFMVEFNKREWRKDKIFPSSLFSGQYPSINREPETGYIHASIIRFGKNGMVLRWHHFLKFSWFLYKNKLKKNRKGLWSNTEVNT